VERRLRRRLRLRRGAVGLEGAGIAGVVLVGSELGGIDEDADGDVAAGGRGGADQGGVAGVERAHGGDQTDGIAAAGAEPRLGKVCGTIGAQFGDGAGGFPSDLRSCFWVARLMLRRGFGAPLRGRW
jgi:hypothetical protein